jgi:DNA repair protein RadA/Sms
VRKSRSVFICQSCSYASPRWLGKCPECGQWNTFLEERQDTQKKGRPGGDGPAARPVPLSRISVSPEPRLKTGLSEVDRVLGGGIVQGSVVLFGGAPGIGKSTLLLQVGEKIAEQGKKVLYISGEESAHQIKMRAERLSVRSDNFFLLGNQCRDHCSGS